MKEYPILFSDPMVRAILSGQKTQTRRVVKPQPDLLHCGIPFINGHGDGGPGSRDRFIRRPYGQPGDRLWVRECFCPRSNGRLLIEAMQRPFYRATDGDGDMAKPKGWRWRPSIHMPRAFSRLVLEIVSVRVERLQDISREDSIAEGVQWDDAMGGYHVEDGSHFNASFATESYRSLWESINGADSWAANPWVWVIEFRRVQP